MKSKKILKPKKCKFRFGVNYEYAFSALEVGER